MVGGGGVGGCWWGSGCGGGCNDAMGLGVLGKEMCQPCEGGGGGWGSRNYVLAIIEGCVEEMVLLIRTHM